jgi:hypothetical protein
MWKSYIVIVIIRLIDLQVFNFDTFYVVIIRILISVYNGIVALQLVVTAEIVQIIFLVK